MQWWDNFVQWFYSDAGSHVFTTAIVPGVAIIVAGVIGALDHVCKQHQGDLLIVSSGGPISTAVWQVLCAPESTCSDLRVGWDNPRDCGEGSLR